jgi:hypothetical protein
MHLVPRVLNVDVISAIVACLLPQTTLARCCWSRLLSTCGQQLRCLWGVVMPSMRYSCYTHGTVDYGILNGCITNISSVWHPLSCPIQTPIIHVASPFADWAVFNLTHMRAPDKWYRSGHSQVIKGLWRHLQYIHILLSHDFWLLSYHGYQQGGWGKPAICPLNLWKKELKLKVWRKYTKY